MTRQEWLAEADEIHRLARRAERRLRVRQLEDDVSEQEAVAINDALRNAIGLQRTMLRVVNSGTSADAGAAAASK